MSIQTDSILFDVLSADPGSPVEGQMWFNTTDQTMKVFRTSGGTSAVQAKATITTTNPLVTSDSASGYAIGSRWINTATDEEFVCCDATVGAAVWKRSSSVLVKTASAEITSNTTTTSTSFVDLLTVNITTGAGFLCIFANGAVSNAGSNINMRLRVLVDGVSIGGMQLRSIASNIGGAFSFNKRVAVAAGARVVKLQWATASNTMRCGPVVNPDAEYASLLVQEVTV